MTPIAVEGTTFRQCWDARIGATPDRIALLIRRERRSSDRADAQADFVPRSWREVDHAVQVVRSALIEAGARPGMPIAHIASNRASWPIVDRAILTLGAVHVPLHAVLPGKTLARQIAHCDAAILIIENEADRGRLESHHSELSSLVSILSHEPCDGKLADRSVASLPLGGVSPDPFEPPWTPGDALTREVSVERSGEIGLTLPDRRPDEVALILYTSGTAGASRGVMLTQQNVLSNAKTLSRIFDYQDDDVRLTALPLSHIYAHTCDLSSWVMAGNLWAVAGSRETILEDLATTSATMMCNVPYFYEKLRRTVMSGGGTSRDEEAATLRALLGGRMRTPRCGGATLSPETYQWYLDRGVTIYQGYGLTEASPVIATSTPGRTRAGSVGQAIDGVEVVLSEAGELLTRGPHVTPGYYKDSDQTARVLRDGWLATGDLATISDDGYIQIVGRRCEQIALSTGKKVMPAEIEAVLTSDPWIEQAVVFGQDRPCLTALIVVSETARATHPNSSTLVSAVAERIAARQAELARHERIAFFAILAEAFSVERGELTGKLSLCRPVIAARHRQTLDGLYDKSEASAFPPGVFAGRIESASRNRSPNT